MASIATKLLRLPAAAAFVAAVSLAGCATPPPADDPDAVAQYKENNDPLEPMNRYFFEVNYALDELLLKPIASWYNAILPTPVEHSVHNFLQNLDAPVVWANDVFQGNNARASVTAQRFLVNSTLGVLGLFDVASDRGLKYHDNDFGVTLAHYKVGEGPYLVIPVIGPTSPRDLTGKVVDSFLDPWGYLFYYTDVRYLSYARTIVQGIDLRARNLDTLDAIRKGAIDYYATIRSLYRQHRNDEIKMLETRDPLSAMRYEPSNSTQLSESN